MSTNYCATAAGAIAWAGTLSGIFGILDLSFAYSKSKQLEQVKQINALCCLNMTGQPTPECQAFLPDTITLHESFMNFFCQYKDKSLEDLPGRITSNITIGSVTGGIAGLCFTALACFGAYKLYQWKRGS